MSKIIFGNTYFECAWVKVFSFQYLAKVQTVLEIRVNLMSFFLGREGSHF